MSTSIDLVVYPKLKEIGFAFSPWLLGLLIRSRTPELFKADLNPPQSWEKMLAIISSISL
jgi:hypothetical protein